MLRQPYVDGQALEDIPDITESIRKQVVSFAERSLDAAPQTGVSPDVVGVRNLIFSPSQTGEPSLKIVDSIPLILNGHTAPNMALLREMTKIKVGKNAFPRMQADAWRLPDAG